MSKNLLPLEAKQEQVNLQASPIATLDHQSPYSSAAALLNPIYGLISKISENFQEITSCFQETSDEPKVDSTNLPANPTLKTVNTLNVFQKTSFSKTANQTNNSKFKNNSNSNEPASQSKTTLMNLEKSISPNL